MYLENVVFDALDPQELGRQWEDAIGGETLTDEPGIFETRLAIEGGPVLDLCFQQVPDLAGAPARLRPVTESGTYADTGPIAALELDSADPRRDADFWAWLTGWTPVAPGALRHPSLRGPVLELHPEPAPKGATKNEVHLDVRLEAGEDADDVEAAVLARGCRRLETDWGEVPWRTYLDPSGNEFCVLPSRA